jgi:hypothetical protein
VRPALLLFTRHNIPPFSFWHGSEFASGIATVHKNLQDGEQKLGMENGKLPGMGQCLTNHKPLL